MHTHVISFGPAVQFGETQKGKKTGKRNKLEQMIIMRTEKIHMNSKNAPKNKEPHTPFQIHTKLCLFDCLSMIVLTTAV